MDLWAETATRRTHTRRRTAARGRTMGVAVEAVLCCPRSGHWSWRVSRVDRHGQNDAARLRTTLAHGVKTCYSDAGIAAGAVVADVLRAAAN